MKKIILTLIVCTVAQLNFAQVLTPQVLSTAGTSFINGSNVLDCTLGEPVTATLNNGTNMMSQGFHQNDMLITAIDEVQNNDITLFPNPTSDVVQIQFAKANETNVIELYTVEGKLISSQSVNSSIVSQVDMSNYSNGTYFLKIKNKESKDKSYQVIKSK